jgi:hypothetical protein
MLFWGIFGRHAMSAIISAAAMSIATGFELAICHADFHTAYRAPALFQNPNLAILSREYGR